MTVVIAAVHIAGRPCTWRDVCAASPGCAPPVDPR